MPTLGVFWSRRVDQIQLFRQADQLSRRTRRRIIKPGGSLITDWILEWLLAGALSDWFWGVAAGKSLIIDWLGVYQIDSGV